MTMPDYSHCMGTLEGGAPCSVPSGPRCYSWTRRGTQAEVALFHSTGDLPMNEIECVLDVIGCVENGHTLSMDEMGRLHDADCMAPRELPCECSAADANQG
jgi:hypothetical protein